ncbi:mitogen-activated protein kinase kinase kinase 14 [Aulostomus maculatus]
METRAGLRSPSLPSVFQGLFAICSGPNHVASNACSDRAMAIPRMDNCNSPFIVATGGSDLSIVGEDGGNQVYEEKDSLVHVIAPHLSRAMLHGTAKHLVGQGQEACKANPCVSIVAQAEREDFQEFSPTKTQTSYSRVQLLKKFRPVIKESVVMSDTEDERYYDGAVQLTHYHLQRKQRRKSRGRQNLEQADEPPIIRGLWVQEIDWLKSAREVTSSCEIIPPPPQFTDSQPCSHGELLCGRRIEDTLLSYDTSGGDDGGDSDCNSGLESLCTHESETDSSCCAEDGLHDRVSLLTFDLMEVSSSSLQLVSSDGFNEASTQSMLGLPGSAHMLLTAAKIDAVLKRLRGKVTRMPKHVVSPFFKGLRAQRDGKTNVNEGFLLHQDLKPCESQYREAEEYCVLRHIHSGSYGDVFCVQDKQTGFTCAAKKVPLSCFGSEEVSAWSALNSPRVVELFGAVREGPNVVLFMDLKPACLAQLLKKMNSLPEDLALHFLHQTLGALEHLHQRKVLHLDVKVDNVLLSADCRDTFLCDFGLSETVDDSGWSTNAFRGAAFPGTETHMAPEVVRGDRLCSKADVWSSCCMLLHMLNGCHPWIRYYSHPLCLHIVNELPPLWEVPSHCNNFTAKVFVAGLQKDAERRASARELRRKTTKALRAVGGLSPRSITAACEKLYQGVSQTDISPCSWPHWTPTVTADPPAAVSAPPMSWVSPWRTTAADEDDNDSEDSDHGSKVDTDSQPRSLRDERDWDTDSEVDIYMGEEDYIQEKWLKSDQDYEGDGEEEEEEEEEEGEEEEWDSSGSTEYLRALRGVFPLLQKGQRTKETSWGSEPELEFLRDGVAVGTRIQTPSPEPRDEPPSCFSCSETSQVDASERDSDRSSDDLSSGVFSSCTSRSGGHLEWLASAQQPSTCRFEGVDIWIETLQGACLRIRERQQVKVGHVAIGISDQVLGKAFTLETLDRKTVSFDREVRESCLWLRCVPAPDRCQRWQWRVRDGKLELRE